jgi:sugar lactone lactonase YvrE
MHATNSALLLFTLALACGGGGGEGEAGATTGTAPGTSTGGTTAPPTSAPTTGGTTVEDPTTEAPGTTLADTSSGGDTTTTTTTDDTGSSEDSSTGEPVDCVDLPQGAVAYTIKVGPMASEDLAFDHEGNLIGAQQGNLFKSPYDGVSHLWVPGAGGFIAGLRATADGTIVYADNDTSTLFRIDPGSNVKQMVLSGLEYANGLEVDLKGYVYVAEQSGSRVRRVDPATGQFTILADGLTSPNGLSFSPDYRKLYVGSFGGGTITTIHVSEAGEPEGVELLRGGIGGGALDGMAVDACGNVYVCEFGPATIWRISPDGQTMIPIVELGQDTGWIPNMQWGSGVGGWDPMIMYVLDFSQNRVFEVPVGVPDKPRGYP